jgi:pimeloyl-ACP methyl ester carboxylesterase
VSRSIRTSIRSVSFILCLIPAAIHAGPTGPVSAPDAVTTAPGSVIVIGFVGGFVKHDDMVHSAVQVAAHLRKDYPSGVYTEVLENHRGGKAYADILRFIDADHDGKLSTEEKRNARIILYGHSWGASEAVTLARELGRDGIPVLLTVQVDSVAKPGENDKVIPANVAEAANFYQLNGLLHGETQIRAADPAYTHIIGNFRFDYKASPIDCKQYPWYDRIFMKAHTQIECDPKVWTQVESMIQSRLPPQH